jgi:hypothetical protein
MPDDEQKVSVGPVTVVVFVVRVGYPVPAESAMVRYAEPGPTNE